MAKNSFSRRIRYVLFEGHLNLLSDDRNFACNGD